MTLRRKTLLVITLTLIALVVLLYVVLRAILMSSYSTLEAQVALRDLNRAETSFQDQATSMERAIHDWSTWDETYRFVQDHNAAYRDSNLGDSTFWTLDVNLMLFVNNANEIVYSKAVALESDWPSTLLAQIEQYARGDTGFLRLTSHVPTAGLVLVDGLPLLIASRPILSDNDVGPQAGTLIWGRYLGKQELLELSQTLRLSIDLRSLNASEMFSADQAAGAGLSAAAPQTIIPADETTLHGYALLNDIYGQPAFLLQTTQDRAIYVQGQASLTYFIAALTVVGIVFAVVMLLLLERLMLAPLSHLSAYVRRIGIDDDFSMRLSVIGHNEFAHLASTLNTMLDLVAQSRAALQQSNTELETRVSERTAELNRAKTRLEMILNNTTDGIVLVSSQRGIEQSNVMFNTMFAAAPDDYFGQPLLSLVQPEERDRLTALIQAVKVDGIGRHEEYRALRADKTLFEARIGLGTIQAKTRLEAGLVCSVEDISPLKQREHQLRYQASLQENVSDAVIATDLNFRIQSWNPAAERIYGWHAEEVLGRSIGEVLLTEFVSEASVERVQQDFIEKGFWSDEVVQYHKEGRTLHILNSTVVFKDEKGELFGMVLVNHDITARKAAELALHAKTQEERTFQAALKALHALSLDLTQLDSLDEFYQQVVEQGLSRLGFERLALFLYDEQEGIALGTFGTDPQGNIVDERHLRFVPDPNGIMLRAFERSERFYFDEHVPLHKDREPVGFGWNAAAVLWNGTRSLGWFVADNFLRQMPASKPLLDILGLYALTVGTLLAQKQGQIALRESEARYRLLAENLSDFVTRTDASGIYIYVSPSSRTMLGYEAEELVGKSAFELIHPDDLDAVSARRRAVLDSDISTLPLSYRVRHKEGHYLWVETTGKIIWSADKTDVLGFVTVSRDLTERKRAEEALHQSQQMLHSVIENIPIRLFWKDRHSIYRGCNTLHAQSLGLLSPQGFIGKSDFDFVPERAAEWMAEDRHVMDSGQSILDEEDFITDSHGASHWVRSSKVALMDGTGGVNGVLVTLEDITERKQVAAELERQRSFLRNVIDVSPSLIFVKDYDARFVLVNPIVARMYHTTVEALIGKTDADFNPSLNEVDNFLEADRRVITSGEPLFIEEPLTNSAGETHWLQTTKVPIISADGNSKYVLGVATDITERKAAEQALQAKNQEERAFQAALKALHAISLDLTQLDSLDAFYQCVVEQGLRRLGFERLALFLYDALTGSAQGTYGTDPDGHIRDEHAFHMIPDPDDIMLQVLEHADRFCVVEQAPLHDEGQPMGVGWNAAAALWCGSQMVGWLVADNLVEQKPASKAQLEVFALYAMTVGTLLGQKQASTALRESEEKFRLLVEAAPGAIVISNRQGTIALVNAEAEQVFGYLRAELLGQPIDLLIPGVQREVHRRHHDPSPAVADHRPMTGLSERLTQRKDGSQFPAEVQLSVVQMQDDWLVISFIADISERKRAHEALQRALEQQKELVDLKSRFISMASHDFRTPMSVILSSTSLLKMQIRHQFGVEQVEPLQKRLGNIDEAVYQMTTLLDDVLTVNRADSGKVEIHPERLDVEALCQKFLQEIQLITDDQHHLTFVHTGETTRLVSDPRLLRQILINLLSNAVKYSPEGGEVRLELRYEPDSVEFRVQDEGIGIPEPDQARLFEGFHRAHNVGEIKGTGLGMAIVKRAVDALGGTISFESQIGRGTIFTICLPLTSETSSDSSASSSMN